MSAPGGSDEIRRNAPPLDYGTLINDFDGYQMLDALTVAAARNMCVSTLVAGVVSVIAPTGGIA